jgi:hypothetical protein
MGNIVVADNSTVVVERGTLYTTRGHSLKRCKTQFNNNLGKFPFSNRVVDTWNDLPEMVVSCKTVNNFKSKLDQYFKEMSGRGVI